MHPAFQKLGKVMDKVEESPTSPPAPPPTSDPEATPEVIEEPDLGPNQRPGKLFKWLEEDDFSVEALLADTAAATLEVFNVPQGAMTITFRLLTEDDKAAAEAQTAPIMNRFFWNDQVNRWATIAMCASSIIKIDGKEWMKDKPLEERIKALRRGKSIAMMDRVLNAFREFQVHTVWLAKELDPKGS